jgi:C_GCAxxG_C_C family probable redox protein
MGTTEIHGIAKSKMNSGYNCCEAVLMACNEYYHLGLPPEVFAVGKFFGGGFKSGCVCGALTGLVMAAGTLQEKYPHPLGKDLAQNLHERFLKKFGSTCCRDIRAKMTSMEKIGNKSCKELTGATAEILCDLWSTRGGKE